MVYLVMSISKSWDDQPYLLTVCSSRAKAEEAIAVLAPRYFALGLWIEEKELDAF